MIQVSQSPFLQALGYAIINSLWQFALLWLVYVLISSVAKLSSHQKYISGIVLQLAGFVWFTGTFIFYYGQCLAMSQTVNLLSNDFALTFSVNEASTVKERFFGWILKTEQFLPYLSVAYLLLLLIIGFKWTQCYRFAQHIKQNGLQKIDVNWRLFVQELTQQMGIKHSVKIYLSELVSTPLTIGFFKPIILIPLSSINNLSTEQMEAVILHELAHIKRLDYLFNIILSVIEALLFFNPFMQLISSQIKRERENSCDDWVLQFEYNVASYARALLQIAASHRAMPTFAMQATDNKKELLNRVKRMIEKKEQKFHYKHQLLALLFITVLLSTITWVSPAAYNRSNTNTANTVVAEPLAAKVDNPLFNPVFFLAESEKAVRIEKEIMTEETKAETVKVHKLPLAVIPRNEKVKSPELATVEVSKISSTNKVELFPAMFLKGDTAVAKQEWQHFLNTHVLRNLEKVEREMKIYQARINSTKARDKAAMIKGAEVLNGLSVALNEVKKSKAEVARGARQVAASSCNDKQHALALKELEELAIQAVQLVNEDWKQIREELQKELDELRKQRVVYTKADADASSKTYKVLHPVVVETSIDPVYSYEYQVEGKEKVTDKKSVSPRTPIIIIDNNIFEMVDPEEEVKCGAAKPAKKKVRKSARI